MISTNFDRVSHALSKMTSPETLLLDLFLELKKLNKIDEDAMKPIFDFFNQDQYSNYVPSVEFTEPIYPRKTLTSDGVRIFQDIREKITSSNALELMNAFTLVRSNYHGLPEASCRKCIGVK